MSASYGWIIDQDHVNTEAGDLPFGREGWMGSRTIRPEVERRLLRGEGTPFRLHSDDEAEADHLDYSGRIILLDPDDGEAPFGPLEDLGRPDV